MGADAEEATKFFGEAERRRRTISTTYGPQGASDTEAWVQEVIKSVLGSQLSKVKPCNPRNGIEGYWLAPEVGAWYGRVGWGEFVSDLKKPVKHPDDYRERPPHERKLRPLSEEDLERLGLVPPTPPQSSLGSPPEPPPNGDPGLKSRPGKGKRH